MKTRVLIIALVMTVVHVAVLTPIALADANEVTIADQFGIAYLPLMVMREKQLLEKQAKAAGLGAVKVNWAKFGGAGMMNDALLSGSVDFGVSGIPALILMWQKTSGTFGVKGVCAVNNTPIYLNTRNPRVKTIADFTDKDKIALPSVKVSIQAITLQMAAANLFGESNYAKLDPFTVTMAHPDGMVALLSGKGEVTGHFTSPPFQFYELEKPGIRKILSSKDVVGDSSFIVAYTTSKFYNANPGLYAAFVRAMEEAMEQIKADKEGAASIYLALTKGKESELPSLVNMLKDPDLVFEMAPKGVMRYAEFMYKVGTIKTKPSSWKELFFPNTYNLAGS